MKPPALILDLPRLPWPRALQIAREIFPDVPLGKKGRGEFGPFIIKCTGWPNVTEREFRAQLVRARDGKHENQI